MMRVTKAFLIIAVFTIGVGWRDGELPFPAQESLDPDVVYVGTPYDVVLAMLEMANISKDDIVYDLGCGDGRVVALAAKKYGCRGVGYDIDPERVRASVENVKKNGVEHLVEIIQADLFTIDLSDADVISLYLLPDINNLLLPQFEKMKPGSRLLFHEYFLDDMEIDETVHMISNEDNVTHSIYMYTTPLEREP